ncbi:MAG: tetratricopeptide repeat protein [Betaproteobacteria bacterium]|nr:tetratricopeptide repeat protein [Betaproteobacteria bacterium]
MATRFKVLFLSMLLAAAQADAAPRKGDKVTPFALDSTSGVKVTEKTLQGADLGVMYFFSTEKCAVCLDGLERLRQVASQYGDDRISLVAVGKQDLGTLKKLPVAERPLVLLAGNTQTLANYNAQYVLPVTYVTGPGGEVLGVLQGGGASTEAMLISLAEKQIQRKKTKSAKGIFEMADKAGGGSLAKAGIGHSLLKEGRLDEAEGVFRALTKDKDKQTAVRGLEGLAEVYLAKGQTDQAIKYANDALAMIPGRSTANLILARAQHKKGQGKEAEQSIARATQDGAQSDFSFQRSDAHLIKGNLLRNKEPSIALTSFKIAARENPHSVEALSNQGALLQAAGDPKQALEVLKKAGGLDPTDKLLHGLVRQAEAAIGQSKDLERQRYIDQTVKDLAARFRENQAKTPANADDWTSPPMVVSILNLQEEAGDPLTARLGVAGVLHHDLQIALAGKGVQVVERAVIDKLLAELNLGSSALADPDTQLKLGRVMAARLMATGGVHPNAGNQSLATLRLVDVETTGIAMSASERMSANPDLAQTAESLAAAIAKTIRDKYPLKGRLALVEGETVILNLGKKHGVAMGQEFSVLGKPEPIELNGKVLGQRETKLGSLRVTKVEDGLAYGAVVARTAAWDKNQRIVQKD